MKASINLSIVIPCYNESGNIPLILERFTEVISNKQDVEVILVNNGSTDGSALVFDRELGKLNDDRFRVVNVEKNQGYGYGILAGLKEAKGEVLAWTHADMQTDPKDVLIAFEKYAEFSDPYVFVKGRRKKRDWIPAFFTWGMQVIASTALKVSLVDIGAQPKLFSRKFYQDFIKTNAPYDFSLDLYAQYWAKKKGRIVEIPVYFTKRLHGEAKGGGSIKTRFKVTNRTIKYIFHLKKELAGQAS